MSAIEPQLLTDPRTEQPAPHPKAEVRPSSGTRDIEVFRRVSTKALCRVVRQLSTLLHAGMPLVPALSALSEQWQCSTSGRRRCPAHRTDPLAQIIEQVRDDVNEGSSLAEAMSRHPGLFSPLLVNMVAAGERSGTLEEVLSRLADILEKRVQLFGKVKAAIAYPAMMATVAAGVVMFLLSFVVPSITRLFAEMKQELPWPTRLLIAVSGFAQTRFVPVIILLCTAVVAGYALYRTRDGRLWADRIKLALPLFGPLVFRLEVARLTRTLGTLMKSGIPVIGAIEITQCTVQNRIVADAVNTVKELVHKGETIADAVKATGMFPPVVFHLIATGQMTGNVEDGMIDIAEMYDTEVETTVRTLTALLEPVILLLMGAVVGFIVLAILLPIFEINQAL